MANKDGIWKNLEVVTDEIDDWKVLMAPHVTTYKNAKGIAQKAHKAMNLVSESVRLLPRITSYYLVWGQPVIWTVVALVTYTLST